ncbi:adenylosuccinate synthetase, partial [Streptosporangium algeriense]
LIGHCCVDEVAYLRDRLDGGARVVAEGAQGSRLDLDHGDYPYVTSSNTTVGAVLTGLGVGPRDIASVLLVTPAYVTKVGGGELPSRLYGELNAELQERGEELDRATDLMRDTGWLDLGWLRSACRLNQADGIVMTKFDVLADFPAIGLYDEDRTPAVRMRPGWSAGDVAAASGGAEA